MEWGIKTLRYAAPTLEWLLLEGGEVNLSLLFIGHLYSLTSFFLLRRRDATLFNAGDKELNRLLDP